MNPKYMFCPHGSGEMLDVETICWKASGSGINYINVWNGHDKNYSLEAFDPDEGHLLQYTGYNDRDGKKLWEGDIVRYDHSLFKGRFTIAFQAGGYEAHIHPNRREPLSKWGMQPDILTRIGNIHCTDKEEK